MTTSRKLERRIEYRPLAGLRGDPRNPKDHDTNLIDESMTRFGFIESIVVDDRTGLLISGHGRTETLTAMHQRGDDPPAGVRVVAGEWQVPVTVGWASTDDLEASGALIALNRAGEVGGWVDQSLLTTLEALRDGGALTEGIGYGDEDIALLLSRVAAVDPDGEHFTTAGDEPTEVDVEGMTFDVVCPSCSFQFNIRKKL